jgi:hypothetical protein
MLSYCFRGPAGAIVKVRYGDGRWLGRNSQKQSLDGITDKLLSVGKVSL